MLNTTHSTLVFKTKDLSNKLIYAKVENWKYSIVLGTHKNWMIMDFINDVTDDVDYEYICQTILDVSDSNM